MVCFCGQADLQKRRCTPAPLQTCGAVLPMLRMISWLYSPPYECAGPVHVGDMLLPGLAKRGETGILLGRSGRRKPRCCKVGQGVSPAANIHRRTAWHLCRARSAQPHGTYARITPSAGATVAPYHAYCTWRTYLKTFPAAH